MEAIPNVRRIDNQSRTSNCLSKFIIWYMNGTLSTGHKRPLNSNDIFQIKEEDSTKILCSQLEKLCDKSEEHNGDTSFFAVISKMAFNRLILIGMCLFFHQAFCIAQCLFLRELLEIITDSGLQGMNCNAFYWAAAIAGCLILQHALYHLSYYKALKLGVNIRGAVIALLYKKILKMPKGSRKVFTTGHISNLISLDSKVLLEGFTLVNYIWIGPLVLVAVTVILCVEIGASCLVGIVLILLLIPIRISLQNFVTTLSPGMMSEKRGTLMNEMFTFMQALKLYRMESAFVERIKQDRTNEISSVKKYTIGKVFSEGVSGVIWYLFLLATFSIYYATGHQMKLSTMLMTLSLSIILYQAISFYFPIALQNLRNIWKSSKKIETFLKCEIELFECDTKSRCGDTSVNLQNVTASWLDGETTGPIIKNVTFKADKENSLLMIVGANGSGKSSILMTVLNELNIDYGKINVNGTTAYAPQTVWLFPGTIKQNILFGNDFEEIRYEEVLSVCCLKNDITSLDDGDLTLIGQGNLPISDGLKAKICLARASYHRASIYLFDDLLSFLDVEVGKQIFEKCIRGFLSSKIIILVTNQIQYLDYATNILCLNKDGTTNVGSLLELSHSGVDIVSLLHPNSHEKHWDEDSAIETDSIDEEQSKSRILGGISLMDIKDSNNATEYCTYFECSQSDANTNSKVQVSYSRFLKHVSSVIGWLALGLLFLFFIVGQVLLTLTDYWFVTWSAGEHQRLSNTTVYNVKWYFYDNPDLNLHIFVGLVFLCVVVNLLRTMFFHVAILKSSCKLHNSVLKSFLSAPMNFFETNPPSYILSHFINDVNILDVYLPSVLYQNFDFALFALAIIILNCISIPVLPAIFLPLIIVFYYMKFYYIRSLRKLRQLAVTSHIPLSKHVSATLSGVTTIRAFGVEQKVINELYACQDYQSEAWIMLLLVRTWIAQRNSCIVILFSIVSFFAPLVAAKYVPIDHVIVGASLVHIFTLNMLFLCYTWQEYDVDSLMPSAERLLGYNELNSEPDDGNSAELRETWPEIGLITGEDASFGYNSTLPYVLRRLYFCVRPKEKIGIVGSPGAGKSSFLLMLFHMAKVSGTVRIDGYSINDLTLHDLRKTISIIPQHPVIFSFSLRQNLDPDMQYTDGDIWEVLEEVQMKDIVMDFPEKLDTKMIMTDYSLPECRLLCLARVLLENRKIVVIDGTTHGSDNRTERIIQQTIQDKFSDCTVIIVAYRLNTIMDLDRIMVIDSGKIAEFDEPFALLQNPDGYFRKLVDQAGRTEATRLEVLADEARKLRQLMLLQNQIAYPGSNLTSSRSKAEILNHFGTRVIFETAL